MSSAATSKTSKENKGISVHAKTKERTSSSRKTLKEVPANKSTQPTLFGKAGFLQIASDSKSKAFTVYADENSSAQSHKKDASSSRPKDVRSALVQTDISGDMVESIESVDFYRELAEKRREALDDSLKENQSLVMENDDLRCEVAELRSTNESLEETVEKARKMADILGPLLDDDNERAVEEESTEASEEEEGAAECTEEN